jgi:hypothetical protein
MATCTVYDASENEHDFDGNEPDLTKVGRGPLGSQDWNDVITRIVVQSGRWRFCEHINAGGQCWDFGPGAYEQGAFRPNVISSVYVLQQ